MDTPQLSSTTAPGKVFASRKELADHYKSDWHKYNLKRREAGLPLLLEADFQARLTAALSLRQEDVRNGTSHLKKGKKQKAKNTNNSNNKKENQIASAANTEGGIVMKSQAAAYDKIKDRQGNEVENEDNKTEEDKEEETPAADAEEEMEEAEAEEENIVIDPTQCLFDRHMSDTLEANAEHMYKAYGFFIPDREYLTDLEGLLGYCHEKIKLGHMW